MPKFLDISIFGLFTLKSHVEIYVAPMLQGGVEPVSDTYLILHTTIHRPVLLRYFL